MTEKLRGFTLGNRQGGSVDQAAAPSITAEQQVLPGTSKSLDEPGYNEAPRADGENKAPAAASPEEGNDVAVARDNDGTAVREYGGGAITHNFASPHQPIGSYSPTAGVDSPLSSTYRPTPAPDGYRDEQLYLPECASQQVTKINLFRKKKNRFKKIITLREESRGILT